MARMRGKELWVHRSSDGHDLIVEVFEPEGVTRTMEYLDTWDDMVGLLVRELWPNKKPQSQGELWQDAGYVILDREVHWTPDA